MMDYVLYAYCQDPVVKERYKKFVNPSRVQNWRKNKLTGISELGSVHFGYDP